MWRPCVLLSLHHLCNVTLREPHSLFGLHCLQQLQTPTLRSAAGLDLRPLTEAAALRSLDVQFDGAHSGLYLGELTQLTSLVFRGFNPEKIAHLTNLQKLSLHGIWDDRLPLPLLSRLTELIGPVELCDRRLERLPLLRLHLKADHAVSMERRLDELSHASSITSLTLQSSVSQESRDIDLSDLAALPGLQALRLLCCFPESALTLPAMTSLTFQSGNKACRLPDAKHCSSLRKIHVFAHHGNCVFSAAQLPPFSMARPLQIRHASRGLACIALHCNLIQRHKYAYLQCLASGLIQVASLDL